MKLLSVFFVVLFAANTLAGYGFSPIGQSRRSKHGFGAPKPPPPPPPGYGHGGGYGSPPTPSTKGYL